MMFRYAGRVFSSNFSVCYKLLLYKFVVALIIIALAVAIFLPNLLPVINDLKELGAIDMIKDTLEKIVSFTLSRDAINENIENISLLTRSVLGNHANRLTNTYIGGAVLILLGYFLSVFADIPTAELLYGATQFQAKYYFSSSILTKFGTAMKYSLLSMCIFLPIDLCISAVSLLMLLGIKGTLSYVAPFFASLTFILLYSLRLAFSAAWAPTVVAESRGVAKAFKESLLIVGERFGRIFSTLLVTVILGFAGSLIVGIFTFGTAWLITGCVFSVFVMSFRFIVYYAVKGKKYYLDYETIVTPKKLLDKEQNFKYDLFDD